MKKNDRLLKFKEDYQAALMAYEEDRASFELWQSQYDGVMQPAQGRQVETLFNFSKELIESQIDSNVPTPKVEADVPTERNKQLAMTAEKMLREEIKRLKFRQENDEDERTVKIHGGSLRLIEWDNSKKTHNTVGASNSLLIHPLQYIPQEGVYRQKLMDYQFVTFEKTKTMIKAQYGKDVELEGVDPQTAEPTQSDETVTQVVCYYKNTKGNIGVFSWAGDTVLIDDDEYNARGNQVCRKCGETKPQGENVCRCGSRRWEKRSLNHEELTEDIVRTDGSIIPAMSLALNDDGTPKLRDVEEPVYESDMYGSMYPAYDLMLDEQMNPIGEAPRTQTVQRTYEEPTKLPYYTPKSWPLCVRKNVSKHKSVLGDSDCEAIRIPQDKANKVSTRIIEKSEDAGCYLTKPKDLNFNFGNQRRQIIELTDPSQANMVQAVELKFDPSGDIMLVNQYYQWAKSILGINDTSQGKPDSTAQSGKAKEIQVSRAMGRQQSKVEMKNEFYADCYRVMFEYMLAYADEPREYSSQNDEGEEEIITFNRYDFLEQDEYGNWYYNDEFTFTVDSQGSAQENRQYVLEVMEKDFSQGLYGDPQDPETMLNLWKDRESMNYPNAKRQVARWQRKVEEMKKVKEEMQALQLEINKMKMETPPEGQSVDLPPEVTGGVPI
ncbi:MAG: hypothetical protein PHE79_05055 [Eubacteriales bacterium]|nr:hypothetical protein [Eubacteriales bacterium]